MQWIILLCGLLMLFLLTRKKPVSAVPDALPVLESSSLHSRLSELARKANGYGYARVRLHGKMLRELEDSIRYLSRFSGDALLPAARPLCENGRLIQKKVEEALLSQRKLPKLPCSKERVPRAWLFAQEVVRTGDVLTSELIKSALAVWQNQQLMTNDELNALPVLLSLALADSLHTLALHCRKDQHSLQAAAQTHLLHKHGKIRAAQQLVRTHSQEKAFWEELLRLEEPAEWMDEYPPEENGSSEHWAHEANRRQAMTSRQIESNVQSLTAVAQMPWNRMLEEASIIHQMLGQDSIYPKMDAESRADYRRQTAWIARRRSRTERAVCDAALLLCRSASSETVASHVGFYLLDDGYPALLSHLHVLTPWRRMKIRLRHHAVLLLHMASWLALIGLLAVGFFSGYAIAILLPFALVFLIAAQQCIFQAVQMYRRPRMLPRIALEQLSNEEKVLAVCPVVLTDAHQALAMVKKLSVMHEANPDPNLHFMLLGDFQDSLTATLSTDAEITAVAFSAIDALCEDTGHAFFYLQRERSYSPGERSYSSRERSHGALETLLRLIQGRSVQDSFLFASVDPAVLRGQYRYVLALDDNTVLSPGSVLKMVGAMKHPLQKRQAYEGKMRGVSMVQPELVCAAHQMHTLFSRFVYSVSSVEGGAVMIDPEPYLNAIQGEVPEGRILNPAPLLKAMAGCAYANDITLSAGCPQKLDPFLARLHSHTRADWQLIPCLVPLVGYSCRKKLNRAARFSMLRRLLHSMLEPLQLLVMIYAAFTGREWLLTASVLLPQIARLFPLTPASFRKMGIRLALLPCEAFVRVDAIVRTLYRMTVTHQHLMEQTPAVHLRCRSDQPSMLFFSINMTFAGFFAAFPLLFHGAWTGLLIALLWASFPFLLPVLEQTESGAQRPSEYMREVLLRLGRETLTFFETAITETDHGLPPSNVQIEPNKGISHHTSPGDIGLYLCSLIAAHRLGLLSVEDLGRRMAEAMAALEALPKWHGLLYHRYDTQTLAPFLPTVISSSESGLLAVSLITCAQGMRCLLPELPAAYHALPLRLDQFAESMQLDRLYDPEASLFYTELHPDDDAFSPEHHGLLSSESRLLSFVSIMLRKVPLRHWQQLERSFAPSGALVSPNGAMAEYMVPLLFQPLIPGTLLARSSQKALRRQKRRRLGGAFGISSSGYHAFDPALHYLHQPFGLPELSLKAGIESNVLAPYASMLCLSTDLKAAFLNLQRMQQLGLEGPLGLFEAADFSPARIEGKAMVIVRSYTAQHQGMILCAVCNVLYDGYIARLFSELPRVHAYRLLLEEPVPRRLHSFRRSLLHEEAADNRTETLLKREAVPLAFPIDAHLLCGDQTSLLIDAQGGGYLKHGEQLLTRFHESCCEPSGMRIYIRDSESGASWAATDPNLTQSVQFEASQALFQAERFDMESELRIWINPLDDACIHCLTLKNRSETERMMEVCSYLEPDPGLAQRLHPFRTERLGRHGAAVCGTVQLWQTLCAPIPLDMFRIQTDRTAFWGRGRSIFAPRAMEMPISAVADSLGSMPEACISLRGQFVLSPKGTAVFCFVTRMAGEKENGTAFCDRYAQVDDVLRTYDSAQTRSRVAVRFLRLTEGIQEAVSRLPGALAYQGQPVGHASAASSLPASALNQSGLSADLPILLYTCCGSINEPLLKLLLNAHAFCRFNGFSYQLVILVEECSRHAEVIADAQALIDASHSREQLNETGGVHLLSRPSLQQEHLLRSTARLILSASGGTLEQQLKERFVSVRARPVYLCRSAARWKQQLPEANQTLLFPNEYGGFLPDTGDYRITLAPGRMTPAPWCNPLPGDPFGTAAAESGLLPGIPADPVSPHGEELFFLRDSENRLIWSLTRLPLGHNITVRITHAPGETTYESSGYGIFARIHCFAAAEENAGLRIIHLQNDSQEERKITLFHTRRLSIQTVSASCMQDRVWSFLPDRSCWAGLCAVDPPMADTASLSSGLFQGLGRHVPFALASMEQLPQADGDTAILSYQLVLKPGESRTLTTALLAAQSQEGFEASLSAIRDSGATQRLRSVRTFWEKRLGIIQFDLPDQALNLLLGRWLPYQVWCSEAEHRSDITLAVLLTLLATQPEAARSHILKSAVPEADLDAKLITICIAAAYLETTQDESILQASVSFSEDQPVSLLQWCLNAFEGILYGAHDLPVTGQGIESVCTGMLLCEAIRSVTPFCGVEDSQALLQRREALLTALERSAWDGAWYLYGWTSEGRKLGSASNEECHITLLPQCLAALCGVSREHCEMAMENAWQLLYEQDAGLIKAAGGILPEAELNEAQNTSIACLAMSALKQLGQDERAWELLGALMPLHHAATRQLAARYRAEPYVMPGLVYAGAHLRGRADKSWDAEAAACFLYVTTQHLLGLRIRGNGLRLRPVVPQSWDSLRITYLYGTSTYHLHAERTCIQATMDGEPLLDGILNLTDDGKIHEAVFPIRS